MQIWSAAGILEKNKLASNLPFLWLVELSGGELAETIKLVNNTENIVWNNEEYICFPMDIDKISEDGKTLPAITLKISNVKGLIQSYVQKYSGFCDCAVSIKIVHAGHLELTQPEMQLDFVINSTKYDEEWISFTLGASNDHNFRFPRWRYINDFCPYHFGDIRCGYSGNANACENTLMTCRIPKRFGGEPGLATAT